MPLDIAGLQRFIDEGEKTPPPVFVGRKDILSDIRKVSKTVHGGGKTDMRGIPGMTRIVQGAPGAGKTSILAQIPKPENPPDRTAVRPRIVSIGSSQLTDSLPYVLKAISAAASFSREDWKKLVPEQMGLGLTGASLSLPKREKADGLETLTDLAYRYPPGKWKTPVILAVDEAQRLSRDRTLPHALLLQGIHDADSGLPISLVLAGLSDTENVAQEIGLTRGLTVHQVDALSQDSSLELMKGFCRCFGISHTGFNDRLDELAAPAEGWPRHLYCAMQALACESLRTGGNLSRIDWTECGKTAREGRLRYYRQQQSECMKEADGLTAAVISHLKPGMKMSGTLRLIEDSVRDSYGMRLPDGMNVKGFYRHLIHQGALQERADRNVNCPIPSFRTYLRQAGEPTPDPDPGTELPEPSPFGDQDDPFRM